MIIRMLGTGPLAQLMGSERRPTANDEWLLYGPTERAIVEPPPRRPSVANFAPPTRWAAE